MPNTPARASGPPTSAIRITLVLPLDTPGGASAVPVLERSDAPYFALPAPAHATVVPASVTSAAIRVDRPSCPLTSSSVAQAVGERKLDGEPGAGHRRQAPTAASPGGAAPMAAHAPRSTGVRRSSVRSQRGIGPLHAGAVAYDRRVLPRFALLISLVACSSDKPAPAPAPTPTAPTAPAAPPRPAMDPAGFDRACAAATDCVVVKPATCDPCGCATEAIASAAMAAFDAAADKLACPPNDLKSTCTPCAVRFARCEQGRCVVAPAS